MEQIKNVKKKTKQNSKEKKTISASANHENAGRLPILKTYKLYIDGKFPRTESGRFYKLLNNKGDLVANVCRASKKDFRNAVVAARKAQSLWAARSAYNKAQIIYRIAETLEGRKSQFCESLIANGAVTKNEAQKEVLAAVDRLVYYAGWCDKYQQIFSSVNPVESSHFNFSFPEPTGVIGIIPPQNNGLLSLVTLTAASIAGGNTVIVIASEKFPLAAIEYAEVLNASDLPGGVVNILTGQTSEMIEPFSSHMDVNAVVYCGNINSELKTIRINASHNVKRVVDYKISDWYGESAMNPYLIFDLQEIKTTWHPVGS